MTFLKLTERFERKLLLPNQELITGKYKWFDQDTEDLYNKNLKDQPEDWYYRTKKVEYNINSAGYRTKEFSDINWSKSIVIFGCSHVFGVGTAEEDTISAQLQYMLNVPVINLGSTGASSLFTLHNSVLLSEAYPTPKAVVSIWSSPYRMPYYTEDRVMHCGNWNYDRFKIGYYWNVEKYNAIMHLRLNAMSFREIWRRKTNYFDLSLFHDTSKILNCDFVKQLDSARDLRKEKSGYYCSHQGKITNKVIAEKIIKGLGLQETV
jgi:hypothetical protein